MLEANNSNDRTEYCFNKIFTNPEFEYEEEVTIFVPFDILMSTILEFCESNYDVKISGTDNNIWNLFGGTNFIEDLFYDNDFDRILRDRYDMSEYFDLDYDEWASFKPWEE